MSEDVYKKDPLSGEEIIRVSLEAVMNLRPVERRVST